MHEERMPAILRIVVLAIMTAVFTADIWQRYDVSVPVQLSVAMIAWIVLLRVRTTAAASTVAGIAFGLAMAIEIAERLPEQRTATIHYLPGRIEGVVLHKTFESHYGASVEIWGTVDLQVAPPSFPSRIRIDVVRRDTTVPLPQVGERVVVMGGVRLPEGYDFPNTFSERGYALTRGVTWLARAYHRDVAVTRDAGSIDSWLTNRRNWLREHIRYVYPEDVAPIVLGLLSGDRSDLTAHDREAFVRAGTAHVLSVSGLHVGVVAGMCMALLSWCGARTRFTLLVVCVMAFVVFTGANPPAVRAGIVAATAFLGGVLERRADPLRLLSVAVLVMWMFDPLVVYSASLHLSVGACLGLIVLAPRIARVLLAAQSVATKRWATVLAKSCAVSIAASTGVALPTAVHVQTISVWGVVTNVAVVPLMSGAMMLSTGVLVLDVIHPPTAEAVAAVTSLLVRLGVAATHTMARAEPTSPSHVGLIALVAVGAVIWLVQTSAVRLLIVRLLLVAVTLWLLWTLPFQQRSPFEMHLRYGNRITIVRWNGLSWLEARTQDQRNVATSSSFTGLDRTLLAYLASEPGHLVVTESGTSASRFVDALESKRHVIRMAYLVDRCKHNSKRLYSSRQRLP
jgi:ComEC/Rec2-related protein